MLMYKITLRFLACFCLVLTASPTFLEAPFSGMATSVLWHDDALGADKLGSGAQRVIW
jgi:hypothetical protein